MEESTIDLVKNLTGQLKRFTELCESFGAELQGTDLTSSVELSYSRLRFNVKRSETICFQYTIFQPGSGGSGSPECYYHDAARVEAVKKHFESLVVNPVSISSGDDGPDHVLSFADLSKYLTVAESIASSAYLCASGDDYGPGYFSTIYIDAERIRLEQVNHMNSRSLDHKHDYTMRELEFEIPLLRQPEGQKRSVGMEEYRIGIMRIRFSDGSSQSKRMCGERIREKIEEEARTWKTGHSGS